MKKLAIAALACCAFGSAHAFDFSSVKTTLINLIFPGSSVLVTAPPQLVPQSGTQGSCTASAGGTSSAATGGSSSSSSSSSSTSTSGICTTATGVQLRP